ncbi:MAG: GGDEF domain-containing protein [Acholeplasma sp.]|jgi:diguanylate cyclase (GGDEF)-like protein|nr:MAG: GGDEF domain-containing protein [Acholeplasma sp.]
MRKLFNPIDFKVKQNYNQANLVYYSSFFAYFLFIPLFIYIGNLLLVSLNIVSFIASFFAIYFNRKKKYAFAAFIFITAILIQTFFEVIMFANTAGFVFFYFNIAVLIIFTDWKKWQKISYIWLLGSLFVISVLHAREVDPMVILPSWLITFFLINNIFLNMMGVGNSALYFVRIADESLNALSGLAMIDSLTKLPNRTAITQLFDQIDPITEWENESLAIVMLDIDHFKEINDTYGHLIGDQVLLNIAKTLEDTCREQDFIARYGGEEFLMLIPIDHVEYIHEIIDAYRQKVANTPITINGIELSLSISIGVLYKPRSIMLNYQEALEKADTLLYQAKQAGRNCIIIERLSQE